MTDINNNSSVSINDTVDTSFCGFIAKIALVIAGLGLVGVAIVEGWQVFARYVLNDSPSWTEPVALLLMSITMMFGAAVGVHRQAHFGFFIAVETSPPTLRKLLLGFARLVVAAIGAVMTVFGMQLLLDSWTYPMAGVALPQGVVYLPITLGGALIGLFALNHLYRGAVKGE